MNTINRRFTLWLSGYYEDFQSMRVISEGEDYAESSFFTNRRDSHAGNTMASQAFNNSRFAFDYLTRSFTARMPIPLRGSSATNEAASLHNEGPSQWLTHDPNRIGSAFYEGRATLTYPDTLGDAASLRTFSFPKRADFSHFASGWGTQNSYYVRQGDTDATYERSSFIVDATHGNPYGATSTRGYGKFQINVSGTSPEDESGIPEDRGNTQGFDNSSYRRHKIMTNSSICGVYLGETGDVPFQSANNIGLPYAYLYPIKSPSGKPFFRHSMSRRYGDWLSAGITDNGSGFKAYDFSQGGGNFNILGGGGSNDKWFPRNIEATSVVATGITYFAGATSIVIPNSLSPPSTQILDPNIDEHLPDKTSGVPEQTIVIGSEVHKYDVVSVNGSGDITFSLTTVILANQIQPTVTYNRWVDQAAGDDTITFYNLGAGNLTPVFQFRQDTSDGQGHPLLIFNNGSGTIRATNARTTNGQSGSQSTPVFTPGTNTSLGYIYHSVTANLASGHGGFVADPQYYVANDPFFKLDNVYGRLQVGDYLTLRNVSRPEKITAVNSDGTIETDGLFLSIGVEQVRKASHGSGNGGTTGRASDGMFGYQPVIVGDTELNAQADGERFTIRLAHQSFDRTQAAAPSQVDTTFMLSVGYNQSEAGFGLNERGNVLATRAAITHTFRPVTGEGLSGSRQTLFTMFENGVAGENSFLPTQLWYDLDIVVDFTNQQYYAFHDGTYVNTYPFNPKTDGTPWTATDFYGWSLGIHFQSGADVNDLTGWQTMTTMIDRAGYIYAISDRLTASLPSNIQQEDVIFDSFKIKSQVDGVTQAEFVLNDDTDLINLPQLVSGRPNWKTLLFRDNDYRPIHSSIVTAVNFKQNAKKKSKDIVLKSSDSIGELDFQFPYFDIGQENGAPSLVSAYRRYEITNYADIFHFGTKSLLNLNPFLGFDEDSKGSTGEYLPRYDQRMRLHSGHPIQIYSNENTNGPNFTEDAWEVSRLVDHFRPDPVDSTKTRVVLKSDFLPHSQDQIPAGVQVAIKGTWRNVGISGSSEKSVPEVGEKGFLTCHTGNFNQEITPHNEMRGLHTVIQAQTVTTLDLPSSFTSISVADTSLFPTSGTVKIGGSGATSLGAITRSYNGKTPTSLTLTSSLGEDVGAGTVVKETTTTDYFLIDKQWTRSLVVESIQDSGGFLRFNFVPTPDFPFTKYELMGGTGFANGDSVLAKNDRMTPTVSPNSSLFRIYVEPNASGLSHEPTLAGLPKQVYTTGSVLANSAGQANVVTTTAVSSLPANLQAALPITLGVGAGGLADALEADLGYVTFAKQREDSFALRNVGSSYSYRNIHTRWARDIPQSLWFQKTFGIIGEYPYGATAWTDLRNAAFTELASAFNTVSDNTITLEDITNFPYAGVCEIWTNNPNPRATNSSQAIMLTSFTYEGKTFVTGTNGTLNNVKFADPNKGIIAISGAAGNRIVMARNIDGDYKHCFVLFADMRNDGSADADGGTRKAEFGLLHPIEQNYKLQVIWADTGKKFVDLKLGADADLWQLNGEFDPATEAAWSTNPSAIMLDYDDPPILVGGRSNSTELSTYYHQWENKAGAFVIIDLSKFFNLNTEANNGRINQNAGGNKQLGDFLVEDAGQPTLIDNYHYQAAATFQNSEAPILQHFNSYRWADAKTTLVNDIVSSAPLSTTTSLTVASATEIDVQDNTAFPTTGSGYLLGNDNFNYTGKGGIITNVRPANLGNDLTGSGTFTTSGGGATVNATGTYTAQFLLDLSAMQAAVTPGTGSGSGVLNWYATTGRAEGTINRSGGALSGATLTISQNDYYSSPPTIRIRNKPQSLTGSITAVLATSAGRLPFGTDLTITNAGRGFTSAPNFVFSTSSAATARATISTTQLVGVTGIGQNAPAGTTVQSGSTIDFLEVLDTTDFPNRTGINSFAGQNTAGLIEAKTTDANGNDFDMKYVFSYSSKTSTELRGVKFRPVKQGETVDTAAAGLWADDVFTVTGVPSMKAEGTVIRASLGSSFPMGFMLKLEGRAKSPGNGAFFEHDKIRIFQTSALFNDWFKQITLPALSDINNVPIMRDFNISADTSGAGTVESLGSVTQAQNKSIFQTLRTMAQAAGVGSGGSLITLNFQMGRDNRMEFRPTYNTGISLDRNNLKISDLKTSKAKSFSHVRVLYNGGDSFVTFPTLNYKTNVRFKFVSALSVASFEQALEIAKQEFQKKKEPSFRIEAEVIRNSNETQRTGPMLENARYGYIADPAVQLMGRNGGYWTAGRGGLHFTGQNNALHGNISGYGLLNLLTHQSEVVLGIGIGGYDGADDYTTTYGTGLAHYPTNDLRNMFPWTQMYYWYGAKSVSYAVQIVHIPKGMPKVSETTSEELRVFISDSVDSIPSSGRVTNETSTKLFNIHFADYSFDRVQSGTKTPKLQATQQGIETITTLGSGFFEVPIPASYWSAGNAAGAKMVVSVNAEYLNAIARHKTGDKFGGNASSGQTGLLLAGGQTAPTFTNVNEFSIFPLGIREYPELGTSATYRAPWYAPRIHITDDVNFLPGTFAQYNDSFLDINEIMFISRVEYEYTTKRLDRVKLFLEREIGRIPDGLESYLASNPIDDTGAAGGGVGGGGGGQNTPPSGGGNADPTSPYIPPTTDAFPFGYDGGQEGTDVNNDKAPLKGGTDSDLGNVGKPVRSGKDYLRLNNDTRILQMGQGGSMTTFVFDSNNLDDSTHNRIKNIMSIDNLLPTGIQGIPGQPRPTKIPQKTRAMSGIDTKFTATEGEAAQTGEGWILPGSSLIGVSEATVNTHHSLVLSGTIPMDSAQPVIGLTAYMSAKLLDGIEQFTLETTILCEDTGETISTSKTITAGQPGSGQELTHARITLVPQQFFASAGIEGRKLKATITRRPGQGSDNMLFSSVVIHGVHFENVVHNNQGTPTTDNLAPFAGDIKDTNTGGFNLNSDNQNLL